MAEKKIEERCETCGGKMRGHYVEGTRIGLFRHVDAQDLDRCCKIMSKRPKEGAVSATR